MTVNDLIEKLDLEVLNLAEGDREITGGYVGDLLSWVMGKAESGDMWVTIMTNVNVVAVASLVDVACVVIADKAEITPDVIEKARAQGINLLRSAKSAYRLCNEQILL
ncbi:MAG: AraC family transcriptional regulator [Clostridia bacterium]|nr:AraC family transcriptional regulator [Clostridia bacterium]